MILGELLQYLPKNINMDVRVVKGEKDISIAEGVTCRVKEITPTGRYAMKVIVE